MLAADVLQVTIPQAPAAGLTSVHATQAQGRSVSRWRKNRVLVGSAAVATLILLTGIVISPKTKHGTPIAKVDRIDATQALAAERQVEIGKSSREVKEPEIQGAGKTPIHATPIPLEVTNDLGMKFVWIPPGTFTMGSPENEVGRQIGGTDETQHKVTLTKVFYIGVHLVTQEQWQQVMGTNPSLFKGEINLPVDSVSWDDSQEFIKKLRENDKDKHAYRHHAA